MKAIPDRILAPLCALGMILAVAVGAHAARGDETSEAGSGASEQIPPPPEVRERRAFGQTITEYERRGSVFLMTVKPRVGPTQYWNDPDGDGQFQRPNSDDIDENVNLPKWRLGGW